MKPDLDIGVDANNVTAAVQKAFSQGNDRRLQELLLLLVKHAHAFIKEGRVTQSEWRDAISFLTACGQITDEARNEFCLLSDILGISSLVDLIAHQPKVTPGSVLGPFHNHDSLWRDNGVDLMGEQAGDSVIFTGRVSNVEGTGIAGASIDFWQNAANALYPAQDSTQDPQNLRCKIKCDESGHFSIKTVMPQPYTVPYDGTVGALLTATNRHCWRPAHFHCIVEAPGYVSLITEVFPSSSQYLDSDAVFGVRRGLTVDCDGAPDDTIKRAQFNFSLAKAK